MTTRLVCGFGRCGTSLALQMLAAGGATVCGEWPVFEPDEVNLGARTDPKIWARTRGRVAKLIDPHVCTPPVSGPVRAVWLRRDFVQQAASQAKFGSIFLGLHNDRKARRALQSSYPRHEQRAHALLRKWTGSPVRIVHFEDMIQAPEKAAGEICEALGLNLDVTRMASAVRPRSTDCYHGLLEVALIDERERGGVYA